MARCELPDLLWHIIRHCISYRLLEYFFLEIHRRKHNYNQSITSYHRFVIFTKFLSRHHRNRSCWSRVKLLSGLGRFMLDFSLRPQKIIHSFYCGICKLPNPVDSSSPSSLKWAKTNLGPTTTTPLSVRKTAENRISTSKAAESSRREKHGASWPGRDTPDSARGFRAPRMAADLVAQATIRTAERTTATWRENRPLRPLPALREIQLDNTAGRRRNQNSMKRPATPTATT